MTAGNGYMTYSITGLRRLAALGLALAGLCLALAISSSMAQTTQDLFTVSRIQVDESAENAVAAREAAVNQAQIDGLNRLLQRLSDAGEHGRLPAAEDLPVDQYVLGYSVENEQVLATRYIASFSVSYDQAAVTELLESRGIAFAAQPSPPVLVLPLLATESAVVLWEESNPWRTAWIEGMSRQSLAHVVLPLGDLGDSVLVNAQAALSGDLEALMALADKYGAESVLVAQAATVDAPVGPTDLQVRVRQYRTTGGQDVLLERISADSPEVAYAQAVERVQGQLAEDWKAAAAPVTTGPSTSTRMTARYASLADWVAIERGLRSAPGVADVRLRRIEADRAELVVRHRGPVQELANSLTPLGLQLSTGAGGWLVQRAPARQG